MVDPVKTEEQDEADKKEYCEMQLVTAKDKKKFRIVLRASGGKQGIGKIIKMIDNLTVELNKQQKDDDSKKDYCEAELYKSEDKKKGLIQDASDLETAIDDETESIATLKTEIEALDDGIRALDKEVADATENRQSEHEESKSAQQQAHTFSRSLVGCHERQEK